MEFVKINGRSFIITYLYSCYNREYAKYFTIRSATNQDKDVFKHYIAYDCYGKFERHDDNVEFLSTDDKIFSMNLPTISIIRDDVTAEYINKYFFTHKLLARLVHSKHVDDSDRLSIIEMLFNLWLLIRIFLQMLL
jgi:hypothetical protein